MKSKFMKFLKNLLICILILAAAFCLVYFGGHALFGDLGSELESIINGFF